MSRRRSLVFSVLLLLPLLLAGMPAGRAWAGALPQPRRIANWEPEFMASSHTYTKAEAIAQAQAFDLIVADSYAFRSYVGAMKAANPRLVLLAYQNGGYSLHDNGSKYPDAWYAHTSTGAKIKSRSFGNYLMDVSDWHWVKTVGDLCLTHLSGSHYDGCFLDSLGPAALSLDYVTGLPINQSTGAVWTQSAYMKVTTRLASKVKSRVPSSTFVAANGIQNGREYFAAVGPTSQLADPIDAAMVELFVRPPFASATTFRSVSDWKLDVDMLVDAGAHGRPLLCVTKVWSKSTTEQKQQWLQYALGTFLLGTNGRSYFAFLSSRDPSHASPLLNVRLGPPTRHYREAGGIYRRRFKRGAVFVNPSDGPLSLTFTHSYLTTSGARVKSLTLQPHTATILLDA